MHKSSAEFELERIEEKIEKFEKELDENRRLAEKVEKDKLWELDKVRREFETRARNFEMKREQIDKELKNYHTQKDRLAFKVEQEKEEEEERDRKLADELYRRRMR